MSTNEEIIARAILKKLDEIHGDVLEIKRNTPLRLERVAVGASLNLPSSGAPQTPQIIPKDYSKTEPQQGSLAAITMQQLSDALDKLAWKETKTGKGWWTRFEDLQPQEMRAKFATKYSELVGSRYLRIGGYAYARYGDQSECLSRYAVKVGEKK